MTLRTELIELYTQRKLTINRMNAERAKGHYTKANAVAYTLVAINQRITFIRKTLRTEGKL